MTTGMITEPKTARRLARAIVSDIALYNKDKVSVGIKDDNIFDLFQEELEEGREFYLSRVDSELARETNFFNIAIVDVMIRGCGSIKSDIW